MKKDFDYRRMGSRIREKREYHHMSREQFAEELDITPRFLSDVEYGYKGLGLPKVLDACRILETTVDYLVGYDYDRCGSEKRTHLEAELLEALHDCSDEQLRYVIEMVKIFVDSHR